jgi:hypothetical protein
MKEPVPSITEVSAVWKAKEWTWEQLPRLLQIEKNTHDLLAEARKNDWEGEVQRLEETPVHIGDKKAQVERNRRLPLSTRP